MAHFRSILTQLFAISHVFYSSRVELKTHDEETYMQYYNYAEFSRRLEHFAEKYPDICNLTSAGRSAGGREVWVIRITVHINLLGEVPGKPRFRYLGNIHGDELLSRQILVYLIDYLLSQYGTDPRVTDLIDNTDIYILPSGNPDGFEKAVEGDCSGSKEGHKHITTSPSFSDQFDPRTFESAPEMFAVVKWDLQKKFVLAGNLKGGSIQAIDPFDYPSCHVTPSAYRHPDHDKDEALCRYLVQTFTENHSIMKEGKSLCPDELNEEFRNRTTAEWTDMQGSIQDFSYFRGNCFEVTLQLSCCKYPLAADLYSEWNNNREALLAFMETVHIGVRGYVMNTSGMGIPGSSISVAGIDHIITAWIFGDYYRLLLPGIYTITASALGYRPSTINNVTVNKGKATLLNFVLNKLSEEVQMPWHSISPVPTVAYRSTEQVLDKQQASTSEPPVKSHRSYSDMEAYLQQISSVYSSHAQLFSIGQSVMGRELFLMKISSNLGTHEPAGKPEIIFVGNLRGNDAVGQKILLNLVEYLCRNYGSEPLITQLVNSTSVHILPCVNPDGYGMAEEASEYLNVDGEFGDGVKHADQQDIDLSWNFPDQIHATRSVRPETRAVMNWMKAHSFVLSARVLGGVLGVRYPGSVDSVDEAVFKSITQAYLELSSHQTSQTCEDLDRNKMNPSAPIGIDLETWEYGNTDTLGVLIGVSCDLEAPGENVTMYWIQNQRPLLHLIQQVHFSVRGRVTDSQSGQAIANATIEVEGSMHQVHTSITGEFWRPLAPGMYQLHAFAPGYVRVSALVTVTVTWVEQVDFELTRDQQSQSETQMEEEEFRRLVENLSSLRSLEELVQNYLPARTLHYRKHTERSEFLLGLHLNFPRITRLYSLGNSWELRPIWALEISGGPESTRPTVPRIRYVAGVHGNAAAGPELLLEFASVLCINYGGNPAITKLIDRSRIVIVPCVNPDGRELAQEGSCFSTTGLTNAHGVDLDTDFIYGNMSAQPETRAMMNLMEGGGFSLSVTLEGGSLMTTYPYDRPTGSAHSEETLKYLASIYASIHPVMHLGYPGCRNGLESVPGGILRGADFKGHMGSMKDYSVDVGLCPEITVYTGCCLYPPAQQLLPLWAEHRSALFAMLLEVHKGLSGVVKDQEGRPVSDAVIKVNGSVFVRTDTQGFFHTLLAPGTQQLQFQASGFDNQLMQVNVSSHQKAVPIMIKFNKNVRHRGQGLVLAAAISITVVLLCLLLTWHIRSAKFSRIRDSFRRLRRLRETLQPEATSSEKLPLHNVFLEDSESEDDAFYLEQR
ncbi:carboxypeptidase D, b isoform X1 [Tachysurus fulvidraco]|uniref:carboxypeptidase D, b isoform X1 n=1 Tax=Tachysurus fulvidraco TaxID=1234273 RepID=UPI001FF0595E|nr:carboxypeptidase D, b isoform X1 [Tachysurus fulvidraco]